MSSKSTTKGFAILSAGAMLSKVVSLVYMPFLTLTLGKTGYGNYAYTYTIYTFIFSVANSGISLAVSKTVAEYIAKGNKKDANRVFKIAKYYMCIFGLILSIALFLFATPIAKFSGYPSIALALRFLSPSILLSTLLSVYRGYFQGTENMIPTAVTQIVEQLLNVVVSLACAFALKPLGIDYAVAGATIGTGVGAFISYLMIRKMYKKTRPERLSNEGRRVKKSEIVDKLKMYATPIVITSALIYGGNIIDGSIIKDSLIISGVAEKTAEGLYGMVNNYLQLVLVPITFITALSQAIIPSISAAMAVDDRKLVNQRVNLAIRITLMLAIPAAIAFTLLAKPVYRLMFPGSYEGHVLMLRGAILIIFWGIYLIENTILQSMNKLYVATTFTVLGIIIKIILNRTIIPSMGITGAVISNIVCYLVPMLLATFYIRNKLKVSIQWRKYITKTGLSAIFMAFFVKIVYNSVYYIISFFSVTLGIFVGLVATAGVCGYIYFITMVAIGGFTEEDFEAIPRIVLRFIPRKLKARIKSY
ncbi:Stage V sporulation protein B [Clostridium bornimense]|uniref:Stage V sporulation protein B n=1 Tax=Clostridium bornimense TaxID=1216932 RepID=W6RSM0_9CLOT|nr:polysaccharide biosynthesis protein [Clostridium bornimense]CDM67243.1 Stage V sporulation protein B [Clostridium bornimense]